MEEISSFIQKGVLYFSLVASGLLLFYGGRLLLKYFSSVGRKSLFVAFIPAYVGCGLIFLHADFGFKVSMDDCALSASAKSLYENQEYFVGIQGHQENGQFQLSAGYCDKRPWFYSFSVAVLHYLSGWRVSNAFIANAFFGAGLIFIVCAFGRSVAGTAGAWISVLLAASIPLVAQNASGGGMDMANATLLALLILLGGFYLRSPSKLTEGALVSVAILLAHTRYESLLYAGPALVVVCLGWYCRGKVILSSPALLLGPLLLPVLLQNRYFRETELLWELHSNVQSPFGLVHLEENFPRALYFLFNLSDTLANSAIASALGLVSFILILVWASRHLLRQWQQRPELLNWGIFTTGVLINFFILMAYHDGKLDRIFASRLALPLYVSFIMAPCLVLSIGNFSKRIKAILLSLISVYILAWTLPANDRELFTERNYVQNEIDWLLDVIAPDVLENDLVIDQKSTAWTLIEKQTLRPRTAVEKVEWLSQQQTSSAFDNIYCIERLEYVLGKDGTLELEPSRLPQGVFQLQPLIQRSFRPFSILRIYRVNAIHPERLSDSFLDRTPHGQRQDYDYNGL